MEDDLRIHDLTSDLSLCQQSGLYWSESWEQFFYRAEASYPVFSRQYPWHWITFHSFTKTWHRALQIPGGLSRSSALAFLVRTGEALKPHELEAGIQTFTS